MTASAEPERRPNYVSRESVNDILERLNKVRADLGEITEDVNGYEQDAQRFALDTTRSVLAMLRDVSNRQTEITTALARTTDPWTPGVQWEPDYIALTSQAGVAAAFLAPHVPAVFQLDASQANQLDDALDTVAVNLERFRRLLVARRTELAGNISREDLVAFLALSVDTREPARNRLAEDTPAGDGKL